MIEKIMAALEALSLEDLQRLQERLNRLIHRKQSDSENQPGQRKNRRARVRIPATLEIEREKEFFYQTHKGTIQDMSVDGLSFTTKATVIPDDILSISFRVPSNGEKKTIDCQAMRIEEPGSGTEYFVAAKAVGRETVIAYREMLKNRGK